MALLVLKESWGDENQLIEDQVDASVSQRLQHPLTLQELVDAETGRKMDTKSWFITKERRQKLTQQTNAMADALESEGIAARLDRGNLCFVGLVSGVVHEIEQFRNINFLPDVAQKNRSIYQKELEFFLSDKPYTRYGVVTNGKRIEAKHLRKSMKSFSRKISKWVHECREDWDMEVFCRVLEFPRGEDGTYHLHANLLYQPVRKLAKGEFSAWLLWTSHYFKTRWKDCGRIENLQEIVKYPFKPESLVGAAPAELSELHHQLYKMRVFSAFGSFAEFRKGYKAAGLKPVKVRGEVEMMRKETFVSRRDDPNPGEDLRPASDPKDSENLVYAVTVPCFMSGPLKEPYALVKSFREFPSGEASQSRFADIMFWRMKALDAWEANGGPDPAVLRSFWEAQKHGSNVEPLTAKPSFKVHNTTITVRETLKDKVQILPFLPPKDRSEPPDPPDFLADFF